VVTQVLPRSPAAEAGVVPGDILLRVGGRELGSAELEAVLDEAGPEPGALEVLRRGQAVRLALEPIDASSPRLDGLAEEVLGARLGDGPDGLRVRQVLPQGRAALAGLEDGDLLLAVDGVRVASRADLRAPFLLALRRRGAGLTVRRAAGERELRLTLP
jgi:serine protease DegQ